MKSKSFLIAVAALAVTASSTNAFHDVLLKRAGLSKEQLAAFEVAQELSREGDVTAARDVLVEAGIDEVVIDQIRVVKSEKSKHHTSNRRPWHELTIEQQAALRVAEQSNDRGTVAAIWAEVGVLPSRVSVPEERRFRYSESIS